MITNSEAGRAWGKGLSGSESMNMGERRIFNAVTLRMFRHLEHGFMQRDRGLIEDGLFKLWWQENLWAATGPGAVAWWQDKRQFFTPAFRQFVDRELEAAQSDPQQNPRESGSRS